MSTIINGRRISLRNQQRIKVALDADSALPPSLPLNQVPSSVSKEKSSRKMRTASKKASTAKNPKIKMERDAVEVKVEEEQKVPIVKEEAHAKVVDKKTHVFVLSEKKVASPPPFDTMIVQFMESKEQYNNKKCSPGTNILELECNSSDKDDTLTTNSNNPMGKFGNKRNSSIGVDSNLSFEFAETQEPCIHYKFD